MNSTAVKHEKELLSEDQLRSRLANKIFRSDIPMSSYAQFFGVSESYLSLYINKHRNAPAKLLDSLGVKKKTVYEIDIDAAIEKVRNVQ